LGIEKVLGGFYQTNISLGWTNMFLVVKNEGLQYSATHTLTFPINYSFPKLAVVREV